MQGLVRTSLHNQATQNQHFFTPALSAVAIVTLPNGAKPAGCTAFNSFRCKLMTHQSELHKNNLDKIRVLYSN